MTSPLPILIGGATVLAAVMVALLVFNWSRQRISEMACQGIVTIVAGAWAFAFVGGLFAPWWSLLAATAGGSFLTFVFVAGWLGQRRQTSSTENTRSSA